MLEQLTAAGYALLHQQELLSGAEVKPRPDLRTWAGSIRSIQRKKSRAETASSRPTFNIIISMEPSRSGGQAWLIKSEVGAGPCSHPCPRLLQPLAWMSGGGGPGSPPSWKGCFRWRRWVRLATPAVLGVAAAVAKRGPATPPLTRPARPWHRPLARARGRPRGSQLVRKRDFFCALRKCEGVRAGRLGAAGGRQQLGAARSKIFISLPGF